MVHKRTAISILDTKLHLDLLILSCGMNGWEEEGEEVKRLNANNGYISPKGILCLAVARKYRPLLSRSQKSGEQSKIRKRKQ